MSRARRALGALVTGAAAALTLVAAAVFALVACGGSSEGTVVAKNDQGVYDYGCQAGGTVTGPAAVPVWGSCAIPYLMQSGSIIRRESSGPTDGGRVTAISNQWAVRSCCG